jgi:hypothetical protein
MVWREPFIDCNRAPADTSRMHSMYTMRWIAPMFAVSALVSAACGKSSAMSSAEREADAAKRVKERDAELLDFQLSIHPGPFAETYLGVKLPRGIELASPKSGLTATIDTTCGRSEIPLGVEFSDPEAAARTNNGFKYDGNYLTVGMFEHAPARLYIDNVGGSATTVTIGDTKLEIPANEVWEGRVQPGTCAHGRKVKIGETEVGTLGPSTEKVVIVGGSGMARSVSRHIIDAKGGRCYRRQERVYSDRATRYEAEKPLVMKGARVYDVPGVIHDFLTKAPRSMKVLVDPNQEMENLRSRYEVSRCR